MPRACDRADVPARDVLVEFFGQPEHKGHVCYLRHVPVANILVEVIGILKHTPHVRNLRRVPSADILVEAHFVLKQRAHVRHLGNVPTGHVRKTRGAAVRSTLFSAALSANGAANASGTHATTSTEKRTSQIFIFSDLNPEP